MDKFLPKTQQKKFRLEAKNLFLTYPKCTAKKERVLAMLQETVSSLEGAIVAEERHADGTPHVHALIGCKTKIRTENARYFDLHIEDAVWHGNYAPCKSLKHAIDYCKKEDNYIEWGAITDNTSQSAIQQRARYNKLCMEKNIKELVDENIISFNQIKTIKQAKDILALEDHNKVELVPRLCIWITGAPGSGKTTWVRNTFEGDLYFKNQNKWWDGYKGENVVVIEDFDYSGYALGHHLKIWADQYRFMGEVKGGSIIPDYKILIITSNYTPDEIWNSDAKERPRDCSLTMAVERRFILGTMVRDQDNWILSDRRSVDLTPISLAGEMQKVKDNILRIKANEEQKKKNKEDFKNALDILKDI